MLLINKICKTTIKEKDELLSLVKRPKVIRVKKTLVNNSKDYWRIINISEDLKHQLIEVKIKIVKMGSGS